MKIATLTALFFATGALATKINYVRQYKVQGRRKSQMVSDNIPADKVSTIVNGMHSWSGGRFRAYEEGASVVVINEPVAESWFHCGYMLDEMRELVANHI